MTRQEHNFRWWTHHPDTRQRRFKTALSAERSARRYVAKHGGQIEIRHIGTGIIATVSRDAPGKLWTTVTLAGCAFL